MLFNPLYTCIQTLLTSCNIIKIYIIDVLHDATRVDGIKAVDSAWQATKT
jgi:hypothetical protein